MELGSSPFPLLHQMLLGVIATAVTVVSVVHIVIGVEPLGLAAAVGMLILTGALVEVSLPWIEDRISRQRAQTRELWERQRDELRDLANRDELTQLQDRRYYYDRMRSEILAASVKPGVSLLF